MGRSWISDRESIQGHFALVHPISMDSQDHFRMIRSHNIAMPSKMAAQIPDNPTRHRLVVLMKL